MEYFSVIYKILKTIEKSMDYEEFDCNSISPSILHITQNRRDVIITELVGNGYINGIDLVPIMGRATPGIKIIRPTLTIKGAEYLYENSMMKKAYNVAKGIKEITPGI